MTEKQQAFLDALFGEARGDPYKAKDIAGYSRATTLAEVTDPLGEEMAKRVNNLITQNAVKAAFAIQEVIEDPTALGNKDKLAAAKDFLDRGGFKSKEKVEVSGNYPAVWVLPKKDEDDDGADDEEYGQNSY